MNRHSARYESSPGPSNDSRLQLRTEANHFVPLARPNAYAYDARAFGLLPQHVNAAEQIYVSPGIPHPEYGFSPPNQAVNYQHMDVFYSGNQQYYIPHSGHGMPQQLASSNDYAQWSTPDDASNSVPVDVETRPTSSGSNTKSRRFSKRRNVKEGEGSRSRSLQSTNSHQTHQKGMVRFSHQKKDSEADSSSVATPENDSVNVDEPDSGKVKESRKKTETKEQVRKNSASKKKKHKLLKESSESQLGVLIDQLTDGTYECMVCCDRVKQQHAVWNCDNCFHVFHMVCIKKWARSPSAHVDEGGWRCPGCQNVSKKFPSLYKCYCGKVREPEWNRRETPHSCGEVCGKKRNYNAVCTHPCNILCHPGPCPPCPASVIKSCQCGKISKKVRCSQQKPLLCEEVCAKLKNCGIHKCDIVCHSDDCNECRILVDQSCFCGKDNRQVLCGSAESRFVPEIAGDGVYICDRVCGKSLSCDSHVCEETCHPGRCPDCSLTPENLKTCPCGRTKLSEISDESGNVFVRTSCTDPTPTCSLICGKPLSCGGEIVHTCTLKCHTGPCPPCEDGISVVRCRCGKSEQDVACIEISAEPYICDRRCNKKRKCGRHKCGKICCTDDEHVCVQICGRKLECKLHRCEDTCHRGNCHTCYNVSFEELACHCGAEVLFPPIPCGTKPPECQRLCVRQHACYHSVNHNCHNEEKCPPCVVLMKKQCNCGKVLRSNIPCHQSNVSCGQPCKKTLPCGHNCSKLCHPDSCVEVEETCAQPCSIMRVECIHPCAVPCHQSQACPPSKCKALVTLKCACGNRKKQVECSESDATLQRLSSESVARQHASVDIRGIFKSTDGKQALACNDECAVLERNRRLAEALDIQDTNMDESEQPKHTAFLLAWAKKEPSFVQWVEQELTNLIDAISWLNQPKRSFSFPSMKRDKRQVVHELAETMHCKSVSVDEEPNRSVVITAVRGVSKIPRTLVSDSLRSKVKVSGFVKAGTGNEAADSASVHQRRLLSTMKMVSMSSGGTLSENRTGMVSSPSTIKSACIPKISTQNTSILSKNLSAAYSSVGRPLAASANSVQMLRSQPKPTRDHSEASARATEKKNPEIDYFDMTE